MLHEKALHEPRRDLLLGLAELNYIEGERLRHSVKPWTPTMRTTIFLASSHLHLALPFRRRTGSYSLAGRAAIPERLPSSTIAPVSLLEHEQR